MYQQFLESVFPSTTLAPSTSAVNAAAKNDEKELNREEKTGELVESGLSKINTAAKFVIDQTVGASLNTLAFIYLMGSLQGNSAVFLHQKTR